MTEASTHPASNPTHPATLSARTLLRLEPLDPGTGAPPVQRGRVRRALMEISSRGLYPPSRHRSPLFAQILLPRRREQSQRGEP